MDEKYTHRNGEIDAPTISGVYWTYNEFGGYRDLTRLAIMPTGQYQIRSLSLCHEWQTLVPKRAKEMGLQWWGPITTPWDVE